MTARPRILLSPPLVGERERERVMAAFASGWIAPLGPDVDAFERELVAQVDGEAFAVALSSGTAALHLALLVAGVAPGDRVLVPSLTFVATANAVVYAGAQPVFVDCEPDTWTIDPALVSAALDEGERRGAPVRAVVAVDLYGQCARAQALEAVGRARGGPRIEDAAEALGARYGGRAAGSFGDAAAFSFNGNKIITTSGGGMLVTRQRAWAERARYLATQAREPVSHYEHLAVGYNYRLSNILAALGRAQLERLLEFVAARRAVRARYVAALGGLPGVRFMPEIEGGESTFWLTCATVDGGELGADRDELLRRFAAADIEARPVWKPMHLQPVYAGCERYGGAVAEDLFARGLCLPSGASLSPADQDRVCEVVVAAHREAA